jgi:glycerol-3-phosphate dehydrogenase
VSNFSAKHRQQIVTKLQEQEFDLLVIGGGITGAGIALDAASRGLSVALIEMQDFASGTSGRSTKLIHGGLRYLKQLEFKLVAEVGRERAIIHRIAPHLTHPEPMLLPITKSGSFGKLSTRLGMWFYEWLAGVKREERHRVLSSSETAHTEPLFNKKGLLGGVLFYEYRTDDARLTLEIIKEAVKRGTIALNYMKASAFIYNNSKVCGVEAEDVLSGNKLVVRANHLVNATGPWVDEMDQLDKSGQGHKLNITKGVHIVVDHKKLPVRQSVYFDAVDKRMIFVIPREGKTYIGTTDTFYKEDKIHPLITPQDKAYLLRCVNACFPESPLALSDIESGWAGLRPLIHKPGKGPSEISRKDETFVWPSGLITIAGGKLTGYRKMAQRVVDLVAEKIMEHEKGSAQLKTCITDRIRLANGPETQNDFSELVKSTKSKALSLGLSETEASLLISRYGANAQHICSRMEELKQVGYQGVLPLFMYAQLLYAIHQELCMSPSDFFIRRTSALYFNVREVRQWREALSLEMQELLGWNVKLKKKFDEELQAAMEKI